MVFTRRRKKMKKILKKKLCQAVPVEYDRRMQCSCLSWSSNPKLAPSFPKSKLSSINIAEAIDFTGRIPLPSHVKAITSISNPFVKHCVKLRFSSSYRHFHGSVVVVGATPIRLSLIRLLCPQFFWVLFMAVFLIEKSNQCMPACIFFKFFLSYNFISSRARDSKPLNFFCKSIIWVK